MDNIISKTIKENKQQIINSMLELLAIPAISPTSGGKGELERAKYLEKLLYSFGAKVKRYEYKDENGIIRPNLISTLDFETNKRRIWLVAHIDTVAPGDLSLWKTDPFKPYEKEGKIFGRGSSDNGQDLIASIFAFKIVLQNIKNSSYAFGIALVADEEMGSTYGIQKLLKEDIFKKDDLILVPDAGDEKGIWIEVAEKGMLWLRFTIQGKQVHASIPDNGTNAYQYSMSFLYALREELLKKFNLKNKIFSPDYSTFELTKHELNVESINIIPGTEISYMDCRILPVYNLDVIIEFIEKKAKEFTIKNKEIKIIIDVVNREDAAPETNANSELVLLLSKKLPYIIKEKPKIIGIGGGTCAAFFRKANIDAVAWSIDNQMAHQIDEYCFVDSIIKDTELFISLFI